MAPAGVVGVSGSSAHTTQQADGLGAFLGVFAEIKPPSNGTKFQKETSPQHPTSGKRAGGWLAKGFSFCSHLPLGPELEQAVP